MHFSSGKAEMASIKANALMHPRPAPTNVG